MTTPWLHPRLTLAVAPARTSAHGVRGVVIGHLARLALVAFACLAAWPAAAEPVQIGEIATGYVYYNRPGASLTDHNADLADCVREADAMHVPPAKPGAVGIDGPVGGIIFHALWDGPLAGIVAVKVENCMLVRRWRAVRLADDEGAQLAAMTTPELAARLTPWIGASSPPGEIVRSFGNEADRPVDFKLASRPAHPDARQLSLRVYASETSEPPAPPAPPDAIAPVKLDPRWPTRPLKPSEIAAPPPGAAVILVRVKGIGPKGGGGIMFARQGPRADVGPAIDDHAPDLAVAALGWLYAKKDGNWFALAVPPGRWRIASSGFLNYCLGSPSFEVGAGEIVYAGTFELAGQNIGPDLDLEPAKAFLAAPSAHLRPATYRNGSRGSCRGFGVTYALEFPGAPFDPDYAFGGAPGR